MARYRDYDYSQAKFIPVHLDEQILPVPVAPELRVVLDVIDNTRHLPRRCKDMQVITPRVFLPSLSSNLRLA